MNLNQRTEHFCRAVMCELVRVRKESGLSQNQLAPPSGLNQSTINLLESGKTTPTVASLFRLCEALGVSPAKILESAMEPLPAKKSAPIKIKKTERAESAEALPEKIVPLRKSVPKPTKGRKRV